MTTRPNIVFIMADQLAAASLGCYGSGVNSTPTLDALAARGTRFDRCYATAPVCAPNRASFLTGRSPIIHGNITNNFTLPNDQPTYAHVLQAHGYRTGGFGKFHTTPMECPTPPDMSYLGFDESVISDDTKWGWYDWVVREHPQHAEAALSMCWSFWPSHPPTPHRAAADAAYVRILDPIKKRSPWHAMYPSPLPAEVHDSTFITDMGLGFMRRHLAERAEQPFFCHISYVDPHDPYDPPEPYASMFRPEDMPPARPADWLKDDIASLRQSRLFLGFDQICDKPDIIAKLRALYHGSLRYLDDQVKRVVDFLEANNLMDNTIIVFTTDHGEMLGDHELFTKGRMHYDMGIRCPLIVAGGGRPGGTISERLTCTLDFFPAFCDWAQVPANGRPPLEGRSFVTGENWPEIAVAFNQVSSVITPDRWRLTRYFSEGKGQMFDLNTDPDEQNNLYYDPAHAARRQELLERLLLATDRPYQVPHYGNMPLLDGKKYPVADSMFQEPIRYYPLPPAPGT